MKEDLLILGIAFTVVLLLFSGVIALPHVFPQSSELPTSEQPQYMMKNKINGIEFGCVSNVNKFSEFWELVSNLQLSQSACLTACQEMTTNTFQNKITSNIENGRCNGLMV